MPRSFRFFYFGYQCLHNVYLLARIKTIAWKESVTLHLHDVSVDDSACEEYAIFSPTMLIVNDRYRWQGPFSNEEVLAMLYDEDFAPRQSRANIGGKVVKGDLVPITPDSVLSTCEPCLRSCDTGICRGKAEWVKEMLEDINADHLGFLHMVDGGCVGGAEYLPSTKVPYPIPNKRDKNAFLTCSFASDDEHDYRTHPLNALVEHLRESGYDTLSVASSDELTFPNGPSKWFLEKGFVGCGILASEQLPRSEIQLLQLRL
ncbi:MAG: hypothetical protein OEM29_02825 [Thermoplasmata archaeon]|nr:hypothetical protein [Thermoplasmata archaeon]